MDRERQTVKEKDAIVDYDQQQLVYVEREDGSYGALTTGAYVSKHYIDDYWQKQQKLRRRCREQLAAGEISPLEYHRLLTNVTADDLAVRAGVSARKVRRHLTPEGFGAVRLDEALRYAEVFGVPLAGLFLLPEGDEQPGPPPGAGPDEAPPLADHRPPLRPCQNPYVARLAPPRGEGDER